MVYAVGDIHGRADLLDKMLDAIEVDGAFRDEHKTLVFLGDYVDRGANSKAVIERLSTLSQPGWSYVFLRGNHDQVMEDFLRDAETLYDWRDFGGLETLLSYGVRPQTFDSEIAFAIMRSALDAAMPAHHREFFDRLQNSYTVGDYFFVHAGIRPGLPLKRQMTDDLLWIRNEFLDYPGRMEKIIVHGHTPQDHAALSGYRIGLDTGAYATGLLSAVALCGSAQRFLTVGEE